MLSRRKNDGWVRAAQNSRSIARSQHDAGWIPLDVHVGDMISNFRNGKRSCHAMNLSYLAGDEIQAALPFLVQGFMILFQVGFQSLDHPDDFLFTHFLAAAESVFVRAVVEQCVGDEIFFPDEQTCTLRPTDRFSTAESDQIVAHISVVP